MSEGPSESMQAMPQQTPILPTGAGEPLLVVRDLRKYFPVKRGVLARVVANVKAVDGISFAISRGETLPRQNLLPAKRSQMDESQ